MTTKTAAQHTAGPWRERTTTIIQFENDPSHTEECAELANANTDETVCYVPVVADSVSCASGESNARLIAAAPEMVDALEAIDNFLTQHLIIGKTNAETDKLGRIHEQVRDAIAKARGER